MKKIYKASGNDAKKRIDIFLFEKERNFTRSQIKKHILEKNILLNGTPVKPSYKLKENDEVSVALPKTHQKLRPNKNIPLDILYEDDAVLVLNKHSGIATHPTAFEDANTLISAVLAYIPGIINVGVDPLRPGVVHRLDKDTSGVIVIAKNEEILEFLQREFRTRRVKKTYLALVHGIVKEPKGSIETEMGRLKRKQVSGKTVQKMGLKGRASKTEYRVLRRFKTEKGDFTFCEISPLTGRTHQIRVAMASIGHHVTGDPLYLPKRKNVPQNLTRMFLHASSIRFSLPNGKIVECEAELPGVLSNVLENIKSE